ncbi:MAG: hypothetical protein QXM00_07600 [Candidatus Bathyarchaeia archaeon]
MTFTVDSITLNVRDFSESSEPIGAEWIAWENEQIVVKRFVYSLKRTWRLSCIEKDVVWQNSAVKYLQQKAAAGETVVFAVNEGDRCNLPAVSAHIVSIELEMEPVGTQNMRRFTIMLKES